MLSIVSTGFVTPGAPHVINANQLRLHLWHRRPCACAIIISIRLFAANVSTTQVAIYSTKFSGFCLPKLEAGEQKALLHDGVGSISESRAQSFPLVPSRLVL